jgi:hypothetical protein
MEDMLRTGKWKIASGTVAGRLPSGLDTTVSYTNFLMPTCWQGEYIVFDSQLNGAIYTGPSKCDPSSPTYINFLWKLNTNNTTLDLYDGFNLIYAFSDSISPYFFDTLVNNASSSPPLVLDTIFGVYDTLLGYTKTLLVLDTIWNFVITPKAIPNYDIYNASITNFSQSSFTLSFNYITTYLDSTLNHTGKYYYTDAITGNNDSSDYNPKVRPDTLHYTLIFNNF